LEWFWPGYLPPGHLVLFDGDPKVGKSLLSLDLCARIKCRGDAAGAVEAAALECPSCRRYDAQVALREGFGLNTRFAKKTLASAACSGAGNAG
jgi:hypothetical protein